VSKLCACCVMRPDWKVYNTANAPNPNRLNSAKCCRFEVADAEPGDLVSGIRLARKKGTAGTRYRFRGLFPTLSISKGVTVRTLAIQALAVTNRASRPTRSPRRGRRLRHPYHSLFEALACTRCGAKVHGIAYRNGKLSRDAACYQFRAGGPYGHPGPEAHFASDATLAALVQRRLCELLGRKDIDLLYLRFVAGWSQAEMARARGCHRSTIKRHEDRITTTVRFDPLLRQFAGAWA